MRHLIVILSLLLTAGTVCRSADNSQLLKQAANAYQKHDYQKALNAYKQLAKTGESTWLYYNMGNTYYRLGDKPQAILCYERALKLDASNTEARGSLQLVREKAGLLNDASMGDALLMRFVASHRSNSWATTALLLFVLALVCLVVYVLADSVLLRKFGFFGSIALLVLSLLSVASAIYAHNINNSRCFAIVTAAEGVKATNSPREAKSDKDSAFALAPGARVEIVDSLTTADKAKWYRVEAADKQGWVKNKLVEKI